MISTKYFDHTILKADATEAQVEKICNEALENAQKNAFTPMIAKPIVPVEHKILQIMTRLNTNRYQTLEDFISDSVSLPDMIAIFMGVLELVKTKRILLVENDDDLGTQDNYGIDTVFTLNENYVPEEVTEENTNDEVSN